MLELLPPSSLLFNATWNFHFEISIRKNCAKLDSHILLQNQFKHLLKFRHTKKRILDESLDLKAEKVRLVSLCHLSQKLAFIELYASF